MAGAIAVYRPGASDTGGAGVCNTPPTPLAPIPPNPKYLIGGVPPVLAVSYTHLTLPTNREV